MEEHYLTKSRQTFSPDGPWPGCSRGPVWWAHRWRRRRDRDEREERDSQRLRESPKIRRSDRQEKEESGEILT